MLRVSFTPPMSMSTLIAGTALFRPPAAPGRRSLLLLVINIPNPKPGLETFLIFKQCSHVNRGDIKVNKQIYEIYKI